MNNMINENQSIKYKIVSQGKTLAERESKTLAEMFIVDLPANLKESARIVPVDSQGREVLLG